MSNRLANPVMQDFNMYHFIVDGDSIDTTEVSNWVGALRDQFTLNNICWTIASVAGQRIGGTSPNMLSRQTAEVIAKFKPNAVNIVLMGGGTNDICSMTAQARTVTDIYNDWVTYVEAVVNAGGICVARTVLPRSQPACQAVTDGVFESSRQSLIALQISYASANNILLARMDLNSDIGQNGDSNDTNFYNADKVHLIAAGYTPFNLVYKTILTPLNQFL